MTAADLASHRSTWEEPISVGYRGVRVWECPPNGQGLAALLALAILEDCAIDPPESAERAHMQIEALRLGFADARWYVTDPTFSPTPLAELLSSEYAATRLARIDPDRAATFVPPRGTSGSAGAGSDRDVLEIQDRPHAREGP